MRSLQKQTYWMNFLNNICHIKSGHICALHWVKNKTKHHVWLQHDNTGACFPPVTHYSMWLLVSWAHCSSTVKSSLADSDHLHDWLKKLTLLVPEVSQST